MSKAKQDMKLSKLKENNIYPKQLKMRKIKIWQLIFTIIIVYSIGIFKVNAQVISCENIKQIVNIIATDTNLTALKGTIAKEKEGKNSAIYYVQTSIWQSLDDNRGDVIIYDYEKQTYVVSGKIWGYVNLSNEYKVVVDSFKTALGQSWISKVNTGPKADSSTIFRNPQTFVVVAIKKTKLEITIDCYFDKKHAEPICIWGDCDNYDGILEYFNFDLYTGTFINGIPCGDISTIKWYITHMQYNGSVLEGKPAGYGVMFQRDSIINDGLFFNGDTVTINKAKKGCQYGNCENGFGLKVIFNSISNEFSGIYIGYFKNGIPEGLGEKIDGEREQRKTFYGYFKNGIANGTGIKLAADGTTFGKFLDNNMSGKYEVEFLDTTTVYEGTSNYGKMHYFDRNNILIRSGYRTLGLFGNKFRFSESVDPSYVKLLETVKSINEIYKYRENKYEEITEQPKVVSTKQVNTHNIKSTLKFLKTYKTSILNTHSDSAYVLIDLTNGNINKPAWVNQYNKYYLQLKKIFGSRWKVLSDGGAAELKKKSYLYQIQYIDDKTKTVKLNIDPQGVRLEIH